jgi:hypothetical protein
MLNDFPTLMGSLLSEPADVSAKYLANSRLPEQRVLPPAMKLAQIKELRKTVLPHRKLASGSAGLRTVVVKSDGIPYKAARMIDGE